MTLPFPPPPPMTREESLVLMEIGWRRGRDKAVAIREIKEKTGLSERAIKEAVQGLRLRHCQPIGSTRRPPYGYYVIETAAEIEETCNALFDQAVSELRVVHMLRGRSDRRLRELLGQLELSINRCEEGASKHER